MSKELEKATGVRVNNQYHSNQLDTFSKVMLKSFSSPIKHSYYELVNKKGKVVHLIETDSKVIVQSAATRLGLDYRLVEFEETYEDLDAVKELKGDTANEQGTVQ